MYIPMLSLLTTIAKRTGMTWMLRLCDTRLATVAKQMAKN